MSRPETRASRPVSRRTTLRAAAVTVGALAVGGALGGCQDGFSTREAGDPAATDPSTSGAPAGSEAPTGGGLDETDPDVRLLGESVADVEAMSALGGCQDGFSTREAGAPAATDPSTSGAPAGSEAPTAAGSDETDPDVRLLGERVADVEAMSALVAATAARHRRLRPQLRPLVALHDAHRAVLDDAGDPSGAARPRRPQVPRSAEAALAEVVRREERHAATLAGSAVEASSGGFARLLASMSASVTQHLVEARA